MRAQSIPSPLPRPSARASLIVPKLLPDRLRRRYPTQRSCLVSRPVQFFDPTPASAHQRMVGRTAHLIEIGGPNDPRPDLFQRLGPGHHLRVRAAVGAACPKIWTLGKSDLAAPRQLIPCSIFSAPGAPWERWKATSQLGSCP